MMSELSQSYTYCERLARQQAGNFFHAFRVLPAPKRRAMCALYAFFRITDDLTDGPQEIDVKRTLLADWRGQLDRALEASYQHPLHAALHDIVDHYRIPRRYLDDVLDGVAMDLEQSRYQTFDELYRYCYRVAAAVGLSCIHIWGFTGAEACRYAESAGIAFQLTNILRDLAEDAGRDRVYLPAEDLARFGYREEDLRAGLRNDAFRELMRYQVERAKDYYERSAPLTRHLDASGRAIFLVMSRTYRGLLEEIERRGYDVFTSRVRLSRWHKLGLALQALPVRWGLLTG
ncbi:MAG: phytoene/squalene synthase family protein [Gemmataceae bacterium]